MPDLNITSLTISGYGGNPVPNRFFCQEGAATTLAVLFPGLWYTCDMPLFHYSQKLLLQRGGDVLQVRTDYTVPAYRSLSSSEKDAWIAADAQAALQVALQQRDYTRVVLIGKSIGTVALAHVISHAPEAMPKAITIWLTPLLNNPRVIAAAQQWPGAALLIAGTADDLYNADSMGRIRASTGAETLLIEGADHSLEIPGDLFASLRVLEQVMRGVADFLELHNERMP